MESKRKESEFPWWLLLPVEQAAPFVLLGFGAPAAWAVYLLAERDFLSGSALLCTWLAATGALGVWAHRRRYVRLSVTGLLVAVVLIACIVALSPPRVVMRAITVDVLPHRASGADDCTVSLPLNSAVAPMDASLRERAGRVKGAQRRSGPLTRPTAPGHLPAERRLDHPRAIGAAVSRPSSVSELRPQLDSSTKSRCLFGYESPGWGERRSSSVLECMW
jgi:hypothetical protein